jgi:GTP-binding protein Era
MKKLFLEIAICGVPNAGKSTFLNAILGQKKSIVSAKAQTTRMPVFGVFENDEIRIHFTDSPGAFKARKGYSLEKVISKQAWMIVSSSENIMIFVDGTKGICQNTEYLLQALDKDKKQNAIAVITKADLASSRQKLELAQTLYDRNIFSEIYMISAKSNAGMQNLMEYLKSIAKEEEIDNNEIEDVDASLFGAEITREIIFEKLQKELPYSCNVVTTSFEEDAEKIVMSQDIFVTRESHKIILIGKKGQQIKEIGALAIDEMENIFKKEVFLSLECRIDQKWRENFEKSILG